MHFDLTCSLLTNSSCHLSI